MRSSYKATQHTISYYNRSAKEFREDTWDHDVTQNYEALINSLEGLAPYNLLDLGCGPGRDLAYFKSRGINVIGVDGSKELVKMARSETGCQVLEQNFLELDLPENYFDGVFANASLFHIPRQELPFVLSKLHSALKNRGVLFSSNPRGNNQEEFRNERYCCFYDLKTWEKILTNAGFKKISHFFRPTGLPRSKQPWLATVWRKP